MALDDYQRKRDFKQSPEPRGDRASSPPASDLRFVVQKHAARNLHFDFRLEHAGVLKSWAVPRGPSLDPSVKRLAVEVEDHPLDYANFEGVIPEGHYGAGRVLIWDRGTWQPHGDVSKMLQLGKLKFRLDGQRLRGEWRLIRTRSKSKQPQWLLSKLADDEARNDLDIVTLYPGSVLTPISSLPEFIPPKLPTLASQPPSGDGWIHELKMDGYRMQAQWRGDGFRLLTRAGHDWTDRYSTLAHELAKLDLRDTIVDGELAALDDEGKSDFDLLQQYRIGMRLNSLSDRNSSESQAEVALAYFAFDLLYLRGSDLRDRPLSERKAALRSLIYSDEGKSLSPRFQYLDHITSGVKSLVSKCQLLGLEGIVSKRIDRSYTSGRASDWLKSKFRYREQFIIVGYETSEKSELLSSLLLGYYDGDAHLQFAGRVGTGWSEKQSAQIITRLAVLSLDHSPLAKKLSAPKRGVNRVVDLNWVQPIVVANVEFASWTNARQLRQASFAGFADESPSHDVTAAALFAERPSVEAFSEKPIRHRDTRSKAKSTTFPGLSHPERMLYPADQITKGDVAAYLFQVNQWLLPHVVSRPLSLLRCSDGIDGEAFFQRHPGKGFPTQIASFKISSENEPLLSIDDLSGLLATAQISAIELHPWGCDRDDIDHPDRMIIDLDPDEALTWNVVVEAAVVVRTALEEHGLQSFVKTTGGKGLHVVVPLAPNHNWDEMFAFSKSLAIELARTQNSLFVASMSKSRRTGRIFLDYHRNRRGSTAIAAYSLRARSGAPVSTPVMWDELHTTHPTQFTLHTVPTRLAEIKSDPWAGIDLVEQSLFA